MKFTVTGSLGNISKPLTTLLIKAGHQVTVISSNPDKKAEIEALGATAAIGSISDTSFLTQAFTGADAVYTMVPPNFAAENYRRYVGNTAKNYAAAIKNAGVTKVVNLSSIGAHLESGTGPIAGVHDAELILNGLEGVAVKHIRAPFFYINFYNDIPMIRHQGIIGANYPAATRIVMVHPEDIAIAVAEQLQHPFTGHSVRYIMSDDRTVQDATVALGTAIGKPELPWIEFTDEQALNGMLQAGLPQEIAHNFTEMGSALRKGILWEDFDRNKPEAKGRTLEEFAQEFAVKYQEQ
ncbi:NAD(P)H-binding protein [Chitinophagaceae bacterium MMS25-I14]